jgi:acetyl esterase/lipase
MSFQIVLFSTALAVGANLAAAGAMAGSCPGGPAPTGVVVRGPVLEIPDASSLCIAKGQSPSTWVRVRLARASRTYPLLMAAAFGKNAVCTVRHNGRGICDIEGQPLDMELKRPQTIEASLSWR